MSWVEALQSKESTKSMWLNSIYCYTAVGNWAFVLCVRHVYRIPQCSLSRYVSVWACWEPVRPRCNVNIPHQNSSCQLKLCFTVVRNVLFGYGFCHRMLSLYNVSNATMFNIFEGMYLFLNWTDGRRTFWTVGSMNANVM